MQSTGFESDLFEEDVSSDALVDAGEDGFADGFEDAFGEDAFESARRRRFEEDGFEDDGFEEDGFEEEDSFEEDSSDEDARPPATSTSGGGRAPTSGPRRTRATDSKQGLEDGFEGDAVEQAFADAMDAEDEDEFIRRVSGPPPPCRVACAATHRAAVRCPSACACCARAPGALAGSRDRRLAAALGGGLSNVIGGAARADAMDAFADIAADEAVSEDEMDEFVPVLAGMAGRYAVRTLTTPGARAARPAAARALGRAVTRATSQAARAIVRRQGPQAIRAVPRVVRRVTIMIRRRRGRRRERPRA